MMRFAILVFTVLFFSCNEHATQKETQHNATPTVKKQVSDVQKPILDLAQANKLATLPIECINVEYPNKLNQVIDGDADLRSPSDLHPAFYGCFDWHSSVHGHWSLVSLLRNFPELKDNATVKQRLLHNISKENIAKEIKYFDGKHNGTFERTYGWAWLLQLALELHMWDDPVARQLEQNLQPLTDLIADKYIEFLPKLNYPVRVGTHTNTAFGLTFAWDYANAVGNTALKNSIEKRARDFYFADANCPLTWEPGGYDFLSPCLQEAAIMKRVLGKEEFTKWLSAFLPQLKDPNFELAVGEVSDRTDGHLVHLDGVNFSRAWAIAVIIQDMPEYQHLKPTAYTHINHSLPNLLGDDYMGSHWLGSFAIYALNSMQE